MKKEKKKINNLYVDGSNLYGTQWELFGPGKYLDFGSLINEIEKIYKLERVYFYASYSPVPKKYLKRKPPSYILNERLFYRSAMKHPKVIFYRGHRSKTSGKEKGVDMHMGCDIVKDVLLNIVDRVILMTGDADFAYPVQITKDYKKKYSLFTLSNRISFDMIYIVKDYFVLKLKNRFKFPKIPKKLISRLKVRDISEKIITKQVNSNQKTPYASIQGVLSKH